VRRFMMVVAAALLMVALAVGTVAATGNLWRAPAHQTIGINNVYEIGNAYGADPVDNTILRLWMETGSASEKCLVTLGEANHSPTVGGIYCSSRYVTLADARGHWGVMVTLMLDGPLVDVDGDPSWYSLNVYQEGAKFFRAPIRCDLAGC
jgi:hypothetical protein